MNITKIELKNFRNYKQLKLNNIKKINMIIGNNGIGKTSILESIYLCSIGKSFRTQSETSLINNDTTNFSINIKLKDNEFNNCINFKYGEYGKFIKYNNNSIKKMTDFIGKYKVILFSPDEIKIIKGSPKQRREYLNIQISQINKNYLKLLKDYNLIIKNKNNYLKKINNLKINNFEFLDVLDQKLAEIGMKIFDLRNEYINNINEYLRKKATNKNINIIYKSDFKFKNNEEILNNLKQIRHKEIQYGLSTFGIHRDDYEIMIDKKDSKELCSQGQQKMAMLYIKLSEVELFIEKYNYKPILLLDDLFSELDINNQNLIINKLSKSTQIFITNTDIKTIKNKKRINVINLNEIMEV